jgi:hypothetical protein
MKRMFLAIGLLGGACSLPATDALAQGKPQTLTRLDVTAVATGYRASKIIGASVVNEANEKVGTIDDLIVSRTDRIPYAIVAVGGFLGVGNKLVAVPMQNLEFSPDQTLFAGATKEFLKTLPTFAYATK